MRIRLAVENDLPRILEMGYEFFKSSQYSQIVEWCGHSAAITAKSLIENTVPSILVVAESGNALIGMVGCVIVPFYLNHKYNMSQELFWYASSEHRRIGVGSALLDAAENESKNKFADFMVMASLAGLRSEAVAKVYKRRGYAPAENTFIKELI